MKTWLVAITLALALPAAALAHHGWSGYDESKPLTVTGIIIESGYEHPHGFVKLDAEGKKWLVVLAPPPRMERNGLPREQLKPGTKATVLGYQNRSDAGEMRAEHITIGTKTTQLRR
jgi:hypothetical protein